MYEYGKGSEKTLERGEGTEVVELGKEEYQGGRHIRFL